MAQSNKWREEGVVAAHETRVMLDSEIAQLRTDLAAAKKEAALAKSQMTQMSESVIKLAEKEQVPSREVVMIASSSTDTSSNISVDVSASISVSVSVIALFAEC